MEKVILKPEEIDTYDLDPKDPDELNELIKRINRALASQNISRPTLIYFSDLFDLFKKVHD
jgi:hypothetical protein